ncbi:hypothetical protein BU14_0356s0008 [Porphyra umbilicalis]|uniref:Uncharacterized protein n=1 Tax=Porphyra umbilicalis TaxID=2786 RepID=A0A1X6NXN8_PORUM|nr:hypothetical protein BU14_0356s0008 [Porphyra umbilicalis]|eukprot:OSX73342.1 hypothetical protein BU14_0356s0008 [Porphyra umbilicalis]
MLRPAAGRRARSGRLRGRGPSPSRTRWNPTLGGRPRPPPTRPTPPQRRSARPSTARGRGGSWRSPTGRGRRGRPRRRRHCRFPPRHLPRRDARGAAGGGPAPADRRRGTTATHSGTGWIRLGGAPPQGRQKPR